MKLHADKFTLLVAAIISLCWIGLLPSSSMAALSGACADCHVMHASQGGADAADEYDILLRADCIGCHTGTGGAGIAGAPHVYKSTTDLAGGDYEYSATKTKGHNPSEIAANADTLTAPPGWSNTMTDTLGHSISDTWAANKLTCSGSLGCHGLHNQANQVAALQGAHHNNTTGLISSGATTPGASYRFLVGVYGYEDPDWEASYSATARNVYYGENRADDEIGSADKNTISYLCAMCHGKFHSDTGTGLNNGLFNDGTMFTDPWIRHPNDIDMPTGGDFATYAYAQTSPVATSNLGVATTPANHNSNIGNAGHRVVMCLTCHRSHASNFNAGLRWDPSTVTAGGGGTTGCLNCHRSKAT